MANPIAMKNSFVRKLAKRNIELFIIIFILGMLLTVFIPLPPVIIDILLIINISLSIIILISTLFIEHPLELSVFPSLLLITTAYRLALNIATTRLILGNPANVEAERAAGDVILMFGKYVAGSQLGVGFIIFVIIIIIQFIVITKGATRISEVAARFTLDAMPGKQMAIDADLNAGLINEQQAKDRRSLISREADFYGAMDGASKFVRGDAIAGIIITIINIIGGLLIGIFVRGMTASQALEVFTKLTIGDGLVSQIPALIISISAGLIVTRTSSESNLGKELVQQVFAIPKALFIAAFFLIILIPTPMPTYPLILIAALIFYIGWIIKKNQGDEIIKKEKIEKERKEAMKKPENVETLLTVDPMELEIGYNLIKLVDPKHGGSLLDRITLLRRQCAIELGIVVPPIRIRDNMQLEPNQYSVKIRGTIIATSSAMPDNFLAMDSGMVSTEIDGIKTTEPAFNLPAIWITESDKQRAENAGYTVVDSTTVIATHLSELIKSNASELLTREDVNSLLDNLKESHPNLVAEVIPSVMKPGEVQKVLQGLLKEGISVRDLAIIIETLGDYATKTKDIEILTEYVRNSLARQICSDNLAPDNKLHVITLDPNLEEIIKASTQRSEAGSFLSLNPETINKIIENINNEIKKLLQAGQSPIILCSPQIRLQVKRIVENIKQPITVLSFNEIVKGIVVESHGTVSVMIK